MRLTPAATRTARPAAPSSRRSARGGLTAASLLVAVALVGLVAACAPGIGAAPSRAVGSGGSALDAAGSPSVSPEPSGGARPSTSPGPTATPSTRQVGPDLYRPLPLRRIWCPGPWVFFSAYHAPQGATVRYAIPCSPRPWAPGRGVQPDQLAPSMA